jgi:hypothetical protein
VAHAYNLSTLVTEQEDHKFKASLSYIVRPFLKNKTAPPNCSVAFIFVLSIISNAEII